MSGQNNNIIRGAVPNDINALLMQAGMVFASVTADPVLPTGVVAFWFRKDLNAWRFQDINGNVQDVVVAAAATQRLLTSVGNNGAGAATLTGAKVGDIVLGISDVTDHTTLVPGTDFEATISVVNQIQQLSATDLSAKTIIVLLLAKS